MPVQQHVCQPVLSKVNQSGHTCKPYLLFYSAGAILPDEGSAYICGHSMQRDMARARQLVGYCPQFDALPGTLTGISSLSSSHYLVLCM